MSELRNITFNRVTVWDLPQDREERDKQRGKGRKGVTE